MLDIIVNVNPCCDMYAIKTVQDKMKYMKERSQVHGDHSSTALKGRTLN